MCAVAPDMQVHRAAIIIVYQIRFYRVANANSKARSNSVAYLMIGMGIERILRVKNEN